MYSDGRLGQIVFLTAVTTCAICNKRNPNETEGKPGNQIFPRFFSTEFLLWCSLCVYTDLYGLAPAENDGTWWVGVDLA